MRRVALLCASSEAAKVPTNGTASLVGRAIGSGSSTWLTADELHLFPVGSEAESIVLRHGLRVDLVGDDQQNPLGCVVEVVAVGGCWVSVELGSHAQSDLALGN